MRLFLQLSIENDWRMKTFLAHTNAASGS